jgi:purine-binding chemotaxis protein CheW
MSKPPRYLSFRLGNDGYVVPVQNVREILVLCPVTPVPRMPAYIRGVINLRGTVVAIADLRLRFGMPTQDDTERSCIVVLQVRSRSGQPSLLGVVVDVVEEVIALQPADIGPAPDFGDALDVRHITGIATWRGQVRSVLDVDEIFRTDASLALPTVPSASA